MREANALLFVSFSFLCMINYPYECVKRFLAPFFSFLLTISLPLYFLLLVSRFIPFTHSIVNKQNENKRKHIPLYFSGVS